MRKARVFVSCGQRSDREKRIGLAITGHFKSRGFDTYFAERVRSPDALTDNIFCFLDRSEYFVFVDFKRDVLPDDTHRGSLFVNQELAIATFLKIPGLGFFEKGVKREGIAEYQIWNALEFEDGTDIIRMLESETTNWDPDSVNELHVSYSPSDTTRDIILSNNPATPRIDVYHLRVTNRNKRKHAFSCSPYLTKLQDVSTGEHLRVPSVELIWSSIGDHRVNIMAGGSMELDAFFVMRGNGNVHFNHRPLTTTTPRFQMPVLRKGVYSLEYSIVSSNFETISLEFRLANKGSHESIVVEGYSQREGRGV